MLSARISTHTHALQIAAHNDLSYHYHISSQHNSTIARTHTCKIRARTFKTIVLIIHVHTRQPIYSIRIIYIYECTQGRERARASRQFERGSEAFFADLIFFSVFPGDFVHLCVAGAVLIGFTVQPAPGRLGRVERAQRQTDVSTASTCTGQLCVSTFFLSS